MKARFFLAVMTTLLAGLLLGGCFSAPAYKAPKPLPPVVQPASVTPPVNDTAAAVSSMQQPLQQLQAAAPTLTQANVDTLRPSIVNWVTALADAWQAASDAVTKAKAAAAANDASVGQLMADIKLRDGQISELNTEAQKLQTQIEADKTEFQRKIYWYSGIGALLVAAAVGLLVYLTQLKAAICTAIGGTAAILFLLALGWVDKFKLEIFLGLIAAALAYLAIETVYRHFNNKLAWWPAFLAALSESPTAT